VSIPNISSFYQRIKGGSEGGGEFARFVRLLLIADYDSQDENFISESDASGDYKGVDAYVQGDQDFPAHVTAFQFKYFSANLSANQKTEIVKSVEKAINENEFIQDFILVTPEDFQKEQQVWFDQLKTRFEKTYWAQSNGISRKSAFKLIHWGHTKIIELALKHDHVGIHYFPELYPVGVGKFKLAEAKVDCNNCNWNPSQHGKFMYYQSFQDALPDLPSDPLFDFHFTNSSAEIFLLQKIEIHMEEIKTLLKGIPPKYFLKSMGTIEYEIDFNKPINTIEFKDPLIIPFGKPQRFKLLLRNFITKCPGNFATFKFWFHFSNYSLSTNSFSLNF